MPSFRLALCCLGAGCLAAALFAACGEGKGEDRPSVEVIGGEGSVSISGVVEGYGEPLYFPGSNQDQNLAIGADLRDMRGLMSAAARNEAVDWAAVTAIYENGKNQKQADGSLRSLASLAAASRPGTFPGTAAVPLDAIIRAGLAGTGRGAGLDDNARRQIVDKGVQILMYTLATERLNEAETRFGARSPAAGTAIDEAWAILSGARDETTLSPNSGLLATGITREEDFQLLGRLSRPLESSLLAALAAVERADPAAFDRQLTASRGYLNTIVYLSVLRYAKTLEADQRASDRSFHLAEAWTFFQAVRPLLAGVNPAAATAIEAAYSRPADQEFMPEQTSAVYAGMNDPGVLRALGIPAEFQFKEPPK